MGTSEPLKNLLKMPKIDLGLRTKLFLLNLYILIQMVHEPCGETCPENDDIKHALNMHGSVCSY